MRWRERERAGPRSQLRAVLKDERWNPNQALSAYDALERGNRLATWPLILLSIISVGAASLVMVFVVDQDFESVLLISFLLTSGAMCIPVFVCISRESQALGADLSRSVLTERTVLGGSQILLLDGFLLIFVCIVAIFYAIPLQLIVIALAHFVAGTAWFPAIESSPWVYLPTLAAAAFAFLCWLTNTEMEKFHDYLLIFPHRVAAELAVALWRGPGDLVMYGLFLGGSVLLVGSTLEVPYEGFAACLPAALLIFRDGLPGRDPELSHLIRLGQIRTALRLGEPGARHRLWYLGRAGWQHDRLQTELDREQWLVRDRAHRIARDAEDVKDRAMPLVDLAFGVSSGYMDQAIEDLKHEISELRDQFHTQEQDQETYCREWLLSAENTLDLFLKWPQPPD